MCLERNMGYHSIINFYKTLKFNWLRSKTSKCSVKWAGSRYIALPWRQLQRTYTPNITHVVTDQLHMCCSIMCCNSSSVDQTMWKWQLFSASFLITPRIIPKVTILAPNLSRILREIEKRMQNHKIETNSKLIYEDGRIWSALIFIKVIGSDTLWFPLPPSVDLILFSWNI